ncbi:MAG: hypothetical protein Q4B87_03225, partial [Candidatus Saccharibacteria bacterium]|nr:hypothetical protein [Candidatus Saccharibacteria bacterium]
MKKSILPIVVLSASLISGEFMSIAPAFAEATDEAVVIAPKDTTKDATNTTPDTTITTSDTPT